MKTLKNRPQKLLIIGPDPFISQSSPDHSPESIFHIMKSRDQTSVLLSVLICFFLFTRIPIGKARKIISLHCDSLGLRRIPIRKVVDFF